MMIEKTVLDYLKQKMNIPASLEVPKDNSGAFLVLEKTGSSAFHHIFSATIVIQSYAPTLYEAAELNDRVKRVMEEIEGVGEVTRCTLNSDYNFTNTAKKQYRYQAVFDLVHY